MKKGIILINIIIIMVILNIMALSVFTMNKNLLNSRILSIRNKEKEIYIKSKINIIDYKINNSFRQALDEFKTYIEKDENTSNSLLKTITNNKIQDFNTSDFASEIYINIDKAVTYTGIYKISYDMSFYDDETKLKQFLYYEISLPQLTKEDREVIKLGDTNKVFEKYKKDLISQKIVY